MPALTLARQMNNGRRQRSLSNHFNRLKSEHVRCPVLRQRRNFNRMKDLAVSDRSNAWVLTRTPHTGTVIEKSMHISNKQAANARDCKPDSPKHLNWERQVRENAFIHKE